MSVRADSQPRARAVLIFRWIVFLLAGIYVVRLVLFSDYSGGLGPFRYLTVWALLASFFCASRMLAYTDGRSDRRWDAVVGMTAVANAMVVFLFWRLYFADPASVTEDGELGNWDMEFYLHGLGPALQWIDALFVHRSFRRPLASAACLALLVGAYVVWSELVVQAVHAKPVGSVTSGLPYPFLNNMELGDRAAFYIANLGLALVFLAGFVALSWVIRRALPPG